MRRTSALVVAAVIVATPVTAYAVTRPAQGPAVSAPVTLGIESWYDLSSTCVSTGVCVSPNMFLPKGTLHVSVSAGALSTLTALQIPATAVPRGSTVTGGTLKVPLDTLSAGNGSATPELSHVEICPTTEQITANAGGTAPAPTGNCSVKALATIVGTPATELDFDLTPIAAALSTPGTNLVLTAADIGTQSDTWHVVFSSNDRTSPPTAAPSLSLTYIPGRPATAAQPGADGGIGGPLGAAPAKPTKKPPSTVPAATQPAPGPGPAVAIPPAVPPAADTANPPVTAPSVAAPPSSAAGAPAGTDAGANGADAPVVLGGHGTLAAESRRTYDYPAVFLLPFLLGIGIFGIGRHLTRPVPGPDDVEPAPAR